MLQITSTLYCTGSTDLIFFDKVKRTINPQKFIQRNWELQFLGAENEKQLQNWLFNNPKMNDILDSTITKDFYQKFKTIDDVYYSHSVSMLLTLSLFFKNKE